MFARKIKANKDYKNVLLSIATLEQLMERNKKMMKAIFPKIEEES
jgi:hypothetical protein